MIGSVVSNIGVAVVVLGIIIVLHELGHFLVAKFFKIKVETFSVGFGPRLIGFRKGDTDYRISAFPLGGYVKMAGETPMDTITGEDYEFLSKPKWQRFLVAAAGPAMNVVLAVALITGLYIYGTEIPEFLIGEVVVGAVDHGSPAEKAGLKAGDEIVSFEGKDKPTWEDVQNQVLTSAGRPLAILVERNGQRMDYTVTPERRGPEDAGYVGLMPVLKTVVRGFTTAASPALKAGMKPGDEIIRVNGFDVRTSEHEVRQVIQEATEKTIPIMVLRDGKEVELEVAPELKDGRKMIGIEYALPTVHVKLGPIDAFKKSLQTNKENAALIFQVFGRLIRREASLKQLNGPVGIVAISGQAYEAGFATLLTFMALISLNLGVLNIMPIPILDGGVILLLIIESLLGRDLSLRMKERIVQTSFVFLLMLTVIVLYNDVVKLLPTSRSAP